MNVRLQCLDVSVSRLRHCRTCTTYLSFVLLSEKSFNICPHVAVGCERRPHLRGLPHQHGVAIFRWLRKKSPGHSSLVLCKLRSMGQDLEDKFKIRSRLLSKFPIDNKMKVTQLYEPISASSSSKLMVSNGFTKPGTTRSAGVPMFSLGDKSTPVVEDEEVEILHYHAVPCARMLAH